MQIHRVALEVVRHSEDSRHDQSVPTIPPILPTIPISNRIYQWSHDHAGSATIEMEPICNNGFSAGTCKTRKIVEKTLEGDYYHVTDGSKY